MRKVTVITIVGLVVDRLLKAIAWYSMEPLDSFVVRGPIMIGFCNAPNYGYFDIQNALSWLLPMVWSISMIALLVMAILSDLPQRARTAATFGLAATVSQFADQILYHAVIDYILIEPIVFNIADVMLWSAGGTIALSMLRQFIEVSQTERSVQNARP